MRGKERPQLPKLSGAARREQHRSVTTVTTGERALLRDIELAEPLDGEIEQRIQLATVERAVLAGALHFDESALAAHHNIHIDRGANVLFIVEIESRRRTDHADAHRRNATLHRRRRNAPVSTSQLNASTAATHAPVIDAVRVPPSATSTSQSSLIVYSPNRKSSSIARMLRPMRR